MLPRRSLGRGRKRHDENTPRLNTICQRPGSIHCAEGTKRTRTMVRKKPARRQKEEIVPPPYGSSRLLSRSACGVCACASVTAIKSRRQKGCPISKCLRYDPMWFAGSRHPKRLNALRRTTAKKQRCRPASQGRSREILCRGPSAYVCC